MDHGDLDSVLALPPAGRGPLGVVLCETAFMAAQTIERLKTTGFTEIIAIGASTMSLPEAEQLHRVEIPISNVADRTRHLNRLLAWARGRWTLLVFNGEFLFYPFCESRKIADFADFLGSERRNAAASYSIDLYSDALGDPNAVFDPREAYFDTEGWYGFERDGKQAEVFGGVGWRFEEYLPSAFQRINRPAFFLADPEAPIRDDLWFEDDLRNAISCPWHNNPTIALMSVRRALSLKTHPNFQNSFGSLIWPGSERFQWRSDQLISYGMMEAGQWL